MMKESKLRSIAMAFVFSMACDLAFGSGAPPAAATSCQAKDLAPANTGWQLGDFLVSLWWNFDGTKGAPAGVAVYDQNLVFKSWVDTNKYGSTSINLTSTGNVVTWASYPVGVTGDCDLVEYAPSGAIVRSFNIGGYHGRVASDGLTGKSYTSHANVETGVHEWDSNGNWIRTLGSGSYGGVCLLPGGVLWAGVTYGTGVGDVHVFDLASGNQTGTITGQIGGPGRYSASTNTVLLNSCKNGLYEVTTTGAFVRKFSYPYYPTWWVCAIGGTRGPGGDVYATVTVADASFYIAHWKADGTWVDQAQITPNIDAIEDIVWTGPAATHSAPTISGPNQVACVLPGSLVTFQESATDPEGTVTTLSASGLPPGATFPTVAAPGSVTGTFNWTPYGADLGSHTITFTAVDSGTPPLSSTRTTTIIVVSSSPISSHPQPRSICAGQTATFSTTATATAYQWQFSENDIDWANIGGATSSSWTTPPFYLNGYVRCIVTTSCGQIATNAARLSIIPSPGSPGNSLRASKATSTSLQLSWKSATAASSYRVLRCDSSGGPCVPALLATVGTIATTDTQAISNGYWYSIEAANSCGVTP